VTVAPPPAPHGFDSERLGRDLLYVRPGLIASLRDIGLAGSQQWSALLDRTGESSGRGTIVRVQLPRGPRVVMKKLRRGGMTAVLWRDRFPGTDRLMANLTLPDRLAERGIATPAGVALLLRPTGLGLHEGWLMTEEVKDARDMKLILGAAPPPRGALAAAMALVHSMHDVGLHHPDLNLGNLLARPGRDRSWEAFVIDLDRARLGSGPLGYRQRVRSIRRLERSYLKQFGDEGPLGDDASRGWYMAYAGDDPDLARRLEASRRAGRFWMRLHRLGWKA
jgi:hypothetical protein